MTSIRILKTEYVHFLEDIEQRREIQQYSAEVHTLPTDKVYICGLQVLDERRYTTLNVFKIRPPKATHETHMDHCILNTQFEVDILSNTGSVGNCVVPCAAGADKHDLYSSKPRIER